MALVHKLDWDPRFTARSPWFWPLATVARSFEGCADWPTLGAFDAVYAERARCAGAPVLRFVDNVRRRDKRRAGRVVIDALYDGRIALRHEVPTRERDWHDFFNMLCFAAFPRAKNALHARQYAALRARVPLDAARLPGARSREQDALTLFDEGGAVIAARPEAAAALGAADAGRDLVARLEADGLVRVVPFGHALFEHLVEGLRCPGGATHIEVVDALPDDAAAVVDLVDRALARTLSDRGSFASPNGCLPLRLDALGLGRTPLRYLVPVSASTVISIVDDNSGP